MPVQHPHYNQCSRCCLFTSSDIDVDFLYDPRYRSGYRHVYARGRKHVAEFRFCARKISRAGFRTSREAAEWVAKFYAERFGEHWPDAIMGTIPRPPGTVQSGRGWMIFRDERGYRLEVCPCGIWCRVVRKFGRKTAEQFPTVWQARRAISECHRRVWPAFGSRILDHAPYQTPKNVVYLPATI